MNLEQLDAAADRPELIDLMLEADESRAMVDSYSHQGEVYLWVAAAARLPHGAHRARLVQPRKRL